MGLRLCLLALGCILPLGAVAATVCPQTLSLGPNTPIFTLLSVAVSHGDPRDAQAYALLKPSQEPLGHGEVAYQWLGLSPPSWPEATPDTYRQVYVTCHYDQGLRLTRQLTPTPQSCAHQQQRAPAQASSDLSCD